MHMFWECDEYTQHNLGHFGIGDAERMQSYVPWEFKGFRPG